MDLPLSALFKQDHSQLVARFRASLGLFAEGRERAGNPATGWLARISRQIGLAWLTMTGLMNMFLGRDRPISPQSPWQTGHSRMGIVQITLPIQPIAATHSANFSAGE